MRTPHDKAEAMTKTAGTHRTVGLTKTISVSCAPDQALRYFTEYAAKWWPVALRQTEGWNFEILTIYTAKRFYERDAKGREVELGKILLWGAPHQLKFECYFITGQEHPTQLTIHFAPEKSGTQVTLEHQPVLAAEPLWEQHRAVFEAAWDTGLSKLAQVIWQEQQARLNDALIFLGS